MKIVVFAPYFFPHKGGLENYCLETVTRLVGFGDNVQVVTGRIDNTSESEELNGFKIIRLNSWDMLGGRFSVPKLSRENFGLLNKVLAREPDAIISNTRFFPLSLWAAIIAKKHKILFIHTEHGTCYPPMEGWLKQLVAIIYDQTIGRYVISSADILVAISKAAGAFSRKLGRKGKIVIIPNSVDTTYFTADSPKPTESLKVIFIGRLIEAKGVHDLIKAFSELKGDNVRLDIIGDGFYKSELVKTAKKDKRIRFLGEYSKDQIKSALSKAQIMVNPSYSEGLPTSVLEAGASGLAVVATDVGGTREIIDDQKNGILIPAKRPDVIKSKLQELVNDPKKAAAFGKKLREKIEKNFDWTDNIKKLRKLIVESKSSKN